MPYTYDISNNTLFFRHPLYRFTKIELLNYFESMRPFTRLEETENIFSERHCVRNNYNMKRYLIYRIERILRLRNTYITYFDLDYVNDI